MVYPDFTNESNTLPWFKDAVNYFRTIEGIRVDGLWVVSICQRQVFKRKILLFYQSVLRYVLGVQTNHLIKVVLKITNNIWFS